MEGAEIISNLLQLADGVGTVVICIYIVWLFINGRILPRTVASDMISAERSGENKTVTLQTEHQQQVVNLFQQIVAEKDARIKELERGLIEKEKLAELGLQFIMSSQRVQDRSAQLIAKISELGPIGMLGTDLGNEE